MTIPHLRAANPAASLLPHSLPRPPQHLPALPPSPLPPLPRRRPALCLANANRLVHCLKAPLKLEAKFRKRNFDAIVEITGEPSPSFSLELLCICLRHSRPTPLNGAVGPY